MKPLDAKIKPDDEKSEDSARSELNPPEVGEDGKPTKKAISTFSQAYSIAKNHWKKANEGRLETAAIIAEKYGGGSPFQHEALKKTGQAWRNNFSTNPLGGVVDRSTPQLSDPIKQAEYLTYSALDHDMPEAASKTMIFRKRTTKLFRSWPGFQTLIEQIAQETYLYGNAAPGCIDPDDWRPRFFRYDETFLPEGTGQHASAAPYIVYLQAIQLQDFLPMIEDKEVADDAGYNMEGCIKAANGAAGIRSKGESSPLQKEDAQREQQPIDYTYDGEAKIIWVYHILVRDYTGKVDLWTVEKNEGHPIRMAEGMFDSVEDVAVLFTFQQGNGKYYGSKGAGRLLTNLSMAVDRSRNLALDQIYLTGLPVFHAKDAKSVSVRVRHPFLIIQGEGQMQKDSVSFDIQGFQWMDNNLVAIMNEIAGAFIPPHTESNSSGATTKIEAAERATRELAVKNGVLGRFLGQFFNLAALMQRKAYSPDNIKEAIRIFEETAEKEKKGVRVLAEKVWKWISEIFDSNEDKKKVASVRRSQTADPDAVQAVVDMLRDGLSAEEIVELALAPTINNVEESPEKKDADTQLFIAAKQGNPYFNQKKMAEMEAQIALGEDRAEQVIQKDMEDPNDEAVATRQQILELMAMQDGEEMMVAATDLHAIHRKTMQPRLAPVIQSLAMAPTKEMMAYATLALPHYQQHVISDLQLKPEERAIEEQLVEQWAKILEQSARAIEALVKQAAQAGVEGGAGALPPQVAGAPVQALGTPNGEIAGENDLQREQMALDASLRLGDQELTGRKLDLEERKVQVQEEHGALKITADALKTRAEKMEAAHARGISDAQNEARAQAAAFNPGAPSI